MKKTGEKYDEFRRHQKNILQFLKDKVRPTLSAASQELNGKNNAFELPEEALAKARFTLALVGSFQCGKSTLFNYLCDGRELSPTGVGGGGIRTSGCRVSAHPLPDSEKKEYAIISWRSKEDLINSFEDVLINDFHNIRDFDLDKPNDRAKLKKKAWELYTKRDTDICVNESDEKRKKIDEELLRIVMIVAHFYPQYKERCAKGKEVKDPESAAGISSYPKKWETRWEKVKDKKGDMGVFSVDDVSFAFCAGIDFHLDSANLRDLGCSIVDCPGYFASNWDSKVADQCIEEANAILYVFSGDKELSDADKKTIQNCILGCGNKHKILFGANLRGTRTQWRMISEESTSPRLAKIMGAPVEVYEFHAAMALRACELDLLEKGRLSKISRQAIERDIEQENKDKQKKQETLDVFLKKQLMGYFYQVEKELPSNETDATEYEELSGGPAFVQAASAVLVSRMGRSILIEEGLERICLLCGRAKTQLEGDIEAICKDKEKSIQDFKDQEAKTRDFEEALKNAKAILDEGVGIAQERVKEYCCEKAEELVKRESYSKRFIEVIAKHVDKICPDLRENKSDTPNVKDFFRDMEEVLAIYSLELRKELQDYLPRHGAITQLRAKYEELRQSMINDVKKLQYIQDMSKVVPQFPTERVFAEKVKLRLSKDSIRNKILAGDLDMIGTIIKWFSLGIITRPLARAEKVYNEKMKDSLLNAIKKQIHHSLYESDRQPKGYCASLNDVRDGFITPVEEELMVHKDCMGQLRKKLDSAEENSKKVESVYRPLLAKVQKLTEECDLYYKQVDRAFPQV